MSKFWLKVTGLAGFVLVAIILIKLLWPAQTEQTDWSYGNCEAAAAKGCPAGPAL